jgi:outer membrane protein assembly factor BamB
VFARLLLVLPLCAAMATVRAADWPQFRGATGQGHAQDTGLPLTWSETQNITWKVPIDGLGWSSPVIAGGQLWLTTAVDEGKSLRAICLDPQSGKQLFNTEIFRLEDPGSIHRKNSHASPTPLIEGDHVYVHFGAHGTACVSTKGKVVWKTQELKYAHRHGPAGSPVLYEDLLILSCDGTDVAFVVALDKRTGQIRWKTPRDGPMAYSTPLVIHAGGRDQVVSTGGDQVVSYEPRTGKEIWRSRYDGYSGVPRPVFGHGLLFICSGYNTPHLFAIRPDGTGDVTDTHVAWSIKAEGAPLNPSPMLVGDELYLVNDNGIATCLDARTGKRHWQNRLGGNFSASPLAADGRIYLLVENGKTTVLSPGREFRVLATNQLDGRTLASLAVWHGSIYLRTDTHLYRIAKR